MTLTGDHVYKKDKNNVEKQFFHWSEENMPPPKFLIKVRDSKTRDKRISKYFVKSRSRDELLAKGSMHLPLFF